MSDSDHKDYPTPADQKFIEGMTTRENTAHEIWKNGSASYLGVHISINDSARLQYGEKGFQSRANQILSRIHTFSSLLALFPDLEISFEDKIIYSQHENQEPTPTIPEFVYEDKNRKLYVTSKAIIADGVFLHELGHHIHTYFSHENNQNLLTIQPWKIIEKGVSRDATVEDLEEFIVVNDDQNNVWFTEREWKLPNKLRTNNRYRHSNPCEMTAEVIADNQDGIMELVNEVGTNNPDNRHTIINYILDKFQAAS